MVRTHKLKTWPEPFAAVLSGAKQFEIRKDDRGFAVGDVLVLQEWDPAPNGATLLSLCAPRGYTVARRRGS